MTDCNTLLGGVPCVTVSEEQQENWESSCDDLIEKALEAYDEFHGNSMHAETAQHWKLVKRRKSLNVYKERDKPKPYEDQRYLCSGVLPGTVEDMMNGAYADDMESMRIATSIIVDMFLDARVVHIFEKNPINSSVVFSGIKWLALKTSASASLVHDRDFLFHNRLGRIIDSQGRYFVYAVMKSVELDEYPANQHNVKRGLVSLCYLFRQFQEELVGCFVVGTSSMGGTLPRSVVHHITIERMLAVQNFLLVARAKAYSARITYSADRIPSTSKSCDVCMKKPKMLSGSLKICMGCRRNTCGKCRKWCTVFRLDIRKQKPGKEKFCTQCISDVTRPTMSSFYMCSLKESTTSSSSSRNQDFSFASMSSGAKHSSSPSSSQSHENLDIDPDAWLPAPSDLDGLASFVDRVSLADMQWNQEELDHYINILQESRHVNVSQYTEHNNCENRRRMKSYKQNFDPANDSHNMFRSDTEDDDSVPQDPNHKFFNVDDLD